MLQKIATGNVDVFMKESLRAPMQQEVESAPAAMTQLWRMFRDAVYARDYRRLGILREFGVAVNRCDAQGQTALMQGMQLLLVYLCCVTLQIDVAYTCCTNQRRHEMISDCSVS